MVENITGFSVRIFIPDGNPEGLKIVEKSNRTIQGIVFPRALLNEARKREELKRAGVYLLYENGELGRLPLAYVGEGDSVLSRLERHANNKEDKDYWTHCVVFTSKDHNLNKAHVQHLESRLVHLAKEVKRCDLDNGNAPQEPSLSDADKAYVKDFLDDMLLCLQIVGIKFFDAPKINNSKNDELHLDAKNITACGIETAQGFIVRKGSTAVKDNTPKIPNNVKEIRQMLLSKDIFRDDGNVYQLAQDYIFSSPSTAASVLLAGSVNGLEVWTDRTGKKLKEIRKTEESSL